MQFEQSAEDVVDKAVNDALVQASYEVRTHLNPLMGFLRLVVDDLVDNTGERQELTEEAYHSAMRLLKNLEVLEENSKLASAQK
jgi:subfamily B ATP-binding cassette protein MsbA